MGQPSLGRDRSVMVWKFCGSISNGDLMLHLSSGHLQLEAKMFPGKLTDEGGPHRRGLGSDPSRPWGQSPASASVAHRFRTGPTWGNKAACLRRQFVSTEQFKLACYPYTYLLCTNQIKNFYSFFDLQIILTNNFYWVLLLCARYLVRHLS